ncbi:uncharacterized protein RAG0_15124 [Rhynchosporium agropyri]|uniref:Heterokaryon incompatibility domain-containing protein n=1 Tax=Rhynchosporium agropyri TaxID=914238 RepID=A0A1E1LJR8_9HELO|nr:uncharacterized protein RAG0_15124 [Rhynchosporium agropyri]
MSGRREQFGLSPQNPMRTQPIIRLGVNRAASASNQKPSPSANIAIEAQVQYKPLDFETYEIRLLRLQWGFENIEDIHCSLEHASLIDPGSYIALSYCWGNFDDAKHIYVDGVKHRATVNLVSALQTIRKLKRNTGDGAFTRLWVDALCINQNDSQERSHQVRTMRQIYSRAQEVLAFAGVCEDRSEGLMKVIGTQTARTLASLKFIQGTSDREKTLISFNSLHADEMPDPKIQALETRHLLDFAGYAQFFNEMYWKRAWVIQEITVGPKVAEGEVWQGIDHLLEFRERYYVKRTPIGLFEALILSRKALATDPRDKIFSLLGLCPDGATFVPVPNYRQPLESIIADMSKAMMAWDKSLDMICLRGVSLKQSTTWIPTWAPNWETIWMGGITVQEESLLKNQDIRNINPILAGSTGLQLKVRGTLIGTVTHLTSATRPHSRDSKPLPPRAPWIDSTATLAAKIPELGSPSPDVSKFLLTIWYELLLSQVTL